MNIINKIKFYQKYYTKWRKKLEKTSEEVDDLYCMVAHAEFVLCELLDKETPD